MVSLLCSSNLPPPERFRFGFLARDCQGYLFIGGNLTALPLLILHLSRALIVPLCVQPPPTNHFGLFSKGFQGCQFVAAKRTALFLLILPFSEGFNRSDGSPTPPYLHPFGASLQRLFNICNIFVCLAANIKVLAAKANRILLLMGPLTLPRVSGVASGLSHLPLPERIHFGLLLKFFKGINPLQLNKPHSSYPMVRH